MKTPLILATLVASVLVLLSLAAEAQAPARPAGGVAVIDLSYIFKNYGKFQDMTANMKRSVEAAEADLKARREELQRLAQQLGEMKLGSPERNKLEADLTQRQADLQVQVAEQKKQFLRQEARIYYMVYQEVSDEIKYYAERNGISLVLRFNGDPIDPNNPQEVLQDLNKSIVYQKGIDITPFILDSLNDRWKGGRSGAPNVSQRSQGVRPRPN